MIGQRFKKAICIMVSRAARPLQTLLAGKAGGEQQEAGGGRR